MATIDEIKAKYCADDASYAASVESKWNSIVKKIISSRVIDKNNPQNRPKIDESARAEAQRLYDHVKSESEALERLVRKMGDASVPFNRGKFGFRIVV